MGCGVLHARSSKQKINSKSSTDTELIWGSDYLPYTLWYIFFRKQGYKVKNRFLFQDNESTIKLLKMVKSLVKKQPDILTFNIFGLWTN